jgi:opine dehydrogenase
MTRNITVCGGGNGAHAMAADLAFRGFKVTLFEHPQFEKNIRKALETKTVEVTGEIEATVTIDNATTSAKEAIVAAETIIFATPTYAQEPFTELMLPFLHEKQKVILTTGNLGSLYLGKRLNEIGTRGVLVGETSTLPYIARMVSPGKVKIIRDKKKFLASAFPATNNAEFLNELNLIYNDAATLTRDVVETFLNNLNPIAHPCGLILNAGRIEAAHMNRQDYFLYREGVSPSIAKVIEAVERERLEVAKALSYKVKRLAENDTVYNVLHDPRLLESVGPNSLEDRYLTEDVPFGLIPLSELAKLVDKKTPLNDAFITIASFLIGTDYWAEGRTFASLGIEDLSLVQLKQFLLEGIINKKSTN